MKRLAVLTIGLALGACATGGGGAPRIARAPLVPIPSNIAGLSTVMGATAARLIAAFGQPISDVREGSARKLQFGNATCVLDAYLYPKGSAEPTVAYVDARQTDGSPIDRASCSVALGHRSAR